MSRRKRGGGAAREARDDVLSAAPTSDVADLEAAAEMLEAAVLEETAALREEAAMRQAEESLATSLDPGSDDAVRVDAIEGAVQLDAGDGPRSAAEAEAPLTARVENAAAATSPPGNDETTTEQHVLDALPDESVEARDPYAVLADYERRSFAHAVASADQVQAPGLWRGIAFRIGTRRLMSSITEVSEILPVLHHTSVPGTQPWLLGVVNVRGTLVPLVDLRGYIEGERTPLGDTSRMLVARHGTNAIGLLVEEVLGQRNLTAENDPLKLENDAANWARFVPAHFDLDGKLWGVFSMAALVSAPDFLHAAA